MTCTRKKSFFNIYDFQCTPDRDFDGTLEGAMGEFPNGSNFMFNYPEEKKNLVVIGTPVVKPRRISLGGFAKFKRAEPTKVQFSVFYYIYNFQIIPSILTFKVNEQYTGDNKLYQIMTTCKRSTNSFPYEFKCETPIQNKELSAFRSNKDYQFFDENKKSIDLGDCEITKNEKVKASEGNLKAQTGDGSDIINQQILTVDNAYLSTKQKAIIVDIKSKDKFTYSSFSFSTKSSNGNTVQFTCNRKSVFYDIYRFECSLDQDFDGTLGGSTGKLPDGSAFVFNYPANKKLIVVTKVPSGSSTPKPTGSSSPKPSGSSSPKPSGSSGPKPSGSSGPKPSGSSSPKPSGSSSPKPSGSSSPKPTGSSGPKPSGSSSPKPSGSSSPKPSGSSSPKPSGSSSPKPTGSSSPKPSPEPSPKPSPEPSPKPSIDLSPKPSLDVPTPPKNQTTKVAPKIIVIPQIVVFPPQPPKIVLGGFGKFRKPSPWAPRHVYMSVFFFLISFEFSLPRLVFHSRIAYRRGPFRLLEEVDQITQCEKINDDNLAEFNCTTEVEEGQEIESFSSNGDYEFQDESGNALDLGETEITKSPKANSAEGNLQDQTGDGTELMNLTILTVNDAHAKSNKKIELSIKSTEPLDSSMNFTATSSNEDNVEFSCSQISASDEIYKYECSADKDFQGSLDGSMGKMSNGNEFMLNDPNNNELNLSETKAGNNKSNSYSIAKQSNGGLSGGKIAAIIVIIVVAIIASIVTTLLYRKKTKNHVREESAFGINQQSSVAEQTV
jgi:hypothetical protein